MKEIKIQSFEDYIGIIEAHKNLGHDMILFRGQSSDYPLLPGIARDKPNINPKVTEMRMLEDLKRRSPILLNFEPKNDWEWLVLAQHFEMKTRLLDWSSNPLIALWFACSNKYKLNNQSYVYIFEGTDAMLVDVKKTTSPFMIRSTKILRPMLNNKRIIAQAGWFTAHSYSSQTKKFIRLETNAKYKNKIKKVIVPAHIKKEILKNLSIYGVNNRTVFPDLAGLCAHINWKYLEREAKT